MKTGESDYRGVGILFSRHSLSACREMAKRSNAFYSFGGATARVNWLKGEYAYLAPNGVASLLRRLCIKFDWLGDEDLLELKRLRRYHTLLLPHAIALPVQAREVLSSWVDQGGYLLATGRIDLPKELLGLSELKWYRPEGYTSIHYGNYNAIAGYRGYTLGIGQPASGSQVLGFSYEIIHPQEDISGGEARPLGPGIIQNGNVLYITLPLFETLGGMLQGHVNFEDMRLWGHRYKYLDWLCRFVKNLLKEAGWQHLWSVRIKPWGEYEGVVVLRHDVDESTDTTYLDYEKKNLIPATYAILGDRNRLRWLKAVAAHPLAEASFHFDASPGEREKFRLLFPSFKGGMRGVLKRTGSKGLWKQMRRAKDVLGIPIVTAQRHNSLFHYPEIVDGMDYLYKQEPEVLGLGTMFRFTNFMFGAKTTEDPFTYTVQHPDTSVPFWFPFKLWYASAEDHHELRGWDITHVLEPEPWLTEHLFNQEQYLEDGVYTLGFHPAHCRGKSFRPEGNWGWFEYAVELGRSLGYLFSSSKEVFQKMNHWERLGFGFRNNEGWIENQNFRDPIMVYLEHPEGPIRFEGAEVNAESIKPNLTKILLGVGRPIRFSIG
jgi:hypothetical protein